VDGNIAMSFEPSGEIIESPRTLSPRSSRWEDYWRNTLHDDKPREECGVFGIVAPDEDVANITYFGLYSLQHRGQESAGITVSDGTELRTVKNVGLVAQVFDDPNLLEDLRGDLALGHTRYSTTGESNLANVQPMVYEHSQIGPIAIAHNGNLTNYQQLRQELESDGVVFDSSSDTEAILKLVGKTPGPDMKAVLSRALPRLKGAFSLVFLTRDSIIGVRDTLGVRPLCIGRLENGGYVIASETCALDTIRAKHDRDVDPGEVVIIDRHGITGFIPQTPCRKATCMLEFIYFARPDSEIMGRNLYEARRRMGRELARQDLRDPKPISADVVVDVPESATPAAHGYAEELGIPFRQGVIKSRYITRTFIQPAQSLREAGVRLKFNPVRPVLEGKRVVLVDDSIIRGTTSVPLVSLLRTAGAREVHVRVASPPIHHPCFLGIDIGSREELLAVGRSEEEICEILGADSVRYLQMDGLVEAVGHAIDNFCLACFNGKYPVTSELFAQAEQ